MESAVWDFKSHYIKNVNGVFDCMLAEFLLSNGRYIPDLDTTLRTYEVTSIEALAQKQQAVLSTVPKLNTLLRNIEIPLIDVLVHMEQTGIRLDSDSLSRVGEAIATEIASLEEVITKETGTDINLNSSVQIGTFLAEKHGVPLSKTKTGKYATNEGELSKHTENFPFVRELLKYRELSKLRSTYGESLLEKVGDDGRIHTTYNQIAVSTGRLSSANPNLQNIPTNSAFGQQIKSCFVASEGNILVSFDYSQQELRILSHLSGEEQLMNAFRNNRDVHRTTASQLFSVPYEQVTTEQRMVAKTINFGIIYGMSSFGMSEGLNIPVNQAQEFINTFYRTYPNIKTFFDQYLTDAKKHRYVETLLGRRRYVFEYPKQSFIDNATRRVLINFPIQGTAADLMKKVMVDIYTDIVLKQPGVRMLLQIHDDLVFEMPERYVKETDLIERIKHHMCHVYPLNVPIEVDVKVGKKWGEMKTVNNI